MPNIDLSILNQRQTPAFYADVFANRPAAGFVGRIFVSTDTYAFYRDNGTGWDLIGGPGTGTVTGSGAAGQVAFWSGSSLISGENNLWWDSTNNHFGINTNTPGTALDVHHDQSTVGILNQTVATNDTRIAFQNSGVAKWRVGNFYNLGSNDYAVNDAVLNINRFTIKSSSGQTFVGDETTSSGLFVVNNSSGDAHIVALGATAPSIRVRNAGVGATLQFGLGLATTTNNFIQGATGGEFCIFNDSLTAQPILFGIKDAGLGNTQEAARISAARNFLIGTTTDDGTKLQVNGFITAQKGIFNSQASGNDVIYLTTAGANTNFALKITGAATDYLTIRRFNNSVGSLDIMSFTFGGNVGIGTTTPGQKLVVQDTNDTFLQIRNNTAGQNFYLGATSTDARLTNDNATPITFNVNGGERARITSSGNLLIGTTTDAGQKLQVNGTSAFSSTVNIGSSPFNLGSLVGTSSLNSIDAKYQFISMDMFTDDARIRTDWLSGAGGASPNMTFWTAGAERMRIKTSGIVNIINTPIYASNALAIAGGLVAGDIYKSATGVLSIVY